MRFALLKRLAVPLKTPYDRFLHRSLLGHSTSGSFNSTIIVMLLVGLSLPSQ